MAILWSAVSSDLFQLEEWDGEGVLYLTESGDTHLLNPIAVHVLLTLNDRILELNELVEQLNKSFHSNSEGISTDTISKILAELFYLGVISKLES